jgi:hypothetical protein
MEPLTKDYEYGIDNAIDKIINLKGQIEATRHLLSVATDIMNNSNERYE